MNGDKEVIDGLVTTTCHKISFWSIYTFPLILTVLAIYEFAPVEIEVMEKVTLFLLYTWLVLISLYLGRIPRLAWNNKASNYNTKIVYWSLFPVFSFLILNISVIDIFDNYEMVNLGEDWEELIKFYLVVFLFAEIGLDFVSLIKHTRNIKEDFDSDSAIFKLYQSEFFSYNRTCWFIFGSGIGAIVIGLMYPSYLAITGVVLSLEHILAGLTD